LDEASKIGIMRGFIQNAAADKVVMKLTPEYYVHEIDALVKTYVDTKNDKALDTPLGATIHTIAAMEGDWGNGEPPLDHAKKWMGDWFEYFKKMYPEKYQKLVEAQASRK
jgi:hypothetical protein